MRSVVDRGTGATARSLWQLAIAPGGQDRHQRRLHRRLVHRLSPRSGGRRLGRLRSEDPDRRLRHGDRLEGRAADLGARSCSAVEARTPGPEFEVPEGLVTARTCLDTGLLAAPTLPDADRRLVRARHANRGSTATRRGVTPSRAARSSTSIRRRARRDPRRPAGRPSGAFHASAKTPSAVTSAPMLVTGAGGAGSMRTRRVSPSTGAFGFAPAGR